MNPIVKITRMIYDCEPPPKYVPHVKLVLQTMKPLNCYSLDWLGMSQGLVVCNPTNSVV